jgi:hypothetical protein
MAESAPNELFLGLVFSLQAAAWMQLGKVMNPMTQKVQRDLPQAKETIDLLGALEEKTRGNLHSDEARVLTQILYELRMNYVEELKTSVAPPAPGVDRAAGAAPTSANAATEPAAGATPPAGTTEPGTGLPGAAPESNPET